MIGAATAAQHCWLSGVRRLHDKGDRSCRSIGTPTDDHRLDTGAATAAHTRHSPNW
jgi:hypothetical protein